MAYSVSKYHGTYLALMPYEIQDIIDQMRYRLILKENVLPCLQMEISNDIPDSNVLVYEFSTMYTHLMNRILDYLCYYSENVGGVLGHFHKLIQIMLLEHYTLHGYDVSLNTEAFMNNADFMNIITRSLLTYDGAIHYMYFNIRINAISIGVDYNSTYARLRGIEGMLRAFTYMELLAFNEIIKNDMIVTRMLNIVQEAL